MPPPAADYVALHKQVDDLTAASARAIVPLVMGWVRPRSVLDVGCGTGWWLAEFAAAGVPDVVGLDGDYLDPAARRVPPGCFRAHDLAAPFDLGRAFDLVVCLEVAEHLPEQGADRLVADLSRHAPVVLFSAAVPGQGGFGHVNERWPSWWAGKFAAAGFDRFDAVRPRVWTDPGVAFWYAQNTFLYVRRDVVGSYPALREPPSPWPADMVHPELQRLKSLPPPPVPPPPPPGLRQVLTSLPGAVGRAARNRLGRRA